MGRKRHTAEQIETSDCRSGNIEGSNNWPGLSEA